MTDDLKFNLVGQVLHITGKDYQLLVLLLVSE